MPSLATLGTILTFAAVLWPCMIAMPSLATLCAILTLAAVLWPCMIATPSFATMLALSLPVGITVSLPSAALVIILLLRPISLTLAVLALALSLATTALTIPFELFFFVGQLTFAYGILAFTKHDALASTTRLQPLTLTISRHAFEVVGTRARICFDAGDCSEDYTSHERDRHDNA